MYEQNPDIVMLSETHVTEDIESSELNLSGYVRFNCDSSSRHTGGVIIFVKSGLQYEVKNSLKVDMYFGCYL